jgi:hypothetical protein
MFYFLGGSDFAILKKSQGLEADVEQATCDLALGVEGCVHGCHLLRFEDKTKKKQILQVL